MLVQDMGAGHRGDRRQRERERERESNKNSNNLDDNSDNDDTAVELLMPIAGANSSNSGRVKAVL